MPVRRLLGALAAVAAAIGVGAAFAAERASVPGPDLRALDGLEFVVTCDFSHRASDDPIVLPGHPDHSHDHTFFGSVETDAFSTPTSLLGTVTTCDRATDSAAYWTPTLLVDDVAVTPVDSKAYYRRRTVAKVRPYPAGLQMIGGNSAARSPQSTRVVFWDCGTEGGVSPSAVPPTCPASRGGKSLHLNVRFPECWEGKRLDSPDHQSHMAYSSRGACPTSHPVAVPSLTLVVHYPVAGGAGVELASVGQLSGHADFVNAWRQDELRRLVDYCLNALRICDRFP